MGRNGAVLWHAGGRGSLPGYVRGGLEIVRPFHDDQFSGYHVGQPGIILHCFEPNDSLTVGAYFNGIWA